MKTIAPPHVVEIEGNAGDARLLASCLAERAPGVESQAFTDGSLAVEALRAWGRAGAAPRVLLLDLHLGVMPDAAELVRDLRGCGALHGVHLVVWSGSPDPDDPARARALGARTFLRKPFDLEGFLALACLLEGLSRAQQAA